MSEKYNLVVIGGGAAGLTASAFGGELGAKVALIEKEKLGGDCTWVGCVPSKALLHVAKIAQGMRTADQYGLSSAEPTVDMKAIKAYVNRVILDVYEGETPEIFRGRGVEVLEGTAEFIDAQTVKVALSDGTERTLESHKFVIATGARPLILPIEGLDTIDYFTNETFFDNERLPEHLIVMGAGAIGMEMAQAYRRLGANVTVIGADVMPRDDEDAVNVLKTVFEREGIQIIETFVEKVERLDDTRFIAHTKEGQQIEGDMMLVAVGRAPTVNGLGLENAGVKFSKRGIEVNKSLQTTQPHIYAVGDVVDGAPKLTHYAGFQGSIAGRNTMFPLVNSSGFTDIYPWATFTDPEVAQVGLTEKEAREKHGDAVKVYTLPLTEGDRSIAEDDLDGFVKIVYKGNGDLLGTTIVASRAGEMIQLYTNAMTAGTGVRGVSATIHAYPSYADVAKKAASKVYLKELFEGTSGRVIDVASKVLYRQGQS